MKAARFLYVVLLLSFAASAYAAPIVKVQTQPDPSGKSLEVSVTEAASPDEAAAAAAWAERDLRNTQQQSSGVTPEIVVAQPGPDGTPEVRALDPDPAKPSFRRVVRDLLERHYRVSFTLIRGTANASVVTWGLILSSHVPLYAALPVGIVAGGMSAGFQYFNQKFQQWLLRSPTPAGRLARTFYVNIGYMAITKLTSLAAGISGESSLVGNLGIVLKTAFLGTLAQGTWNLGVAENARIASEQNPARAGHIRRMNDFKTLAISMVSTALSVATLVGAPLTDAAMIAMTGTGALFYGWTFLKARRWAKEKAVRDGLMASCSNQLRS